MNQHTNSKYKWFATLNLEIKILTFYFLGIINLSLHLVKEIVNVTSRHILIIKDPSEGNEIWYLY